MKFNFYFSQKYIPIIFLSLLILISSCGSRRNLLFNSGNEKNIPNVPVYEMQKGSDSLYNSTDQILKAGDQLEILNLKSEILISGISNTTGEGQMSNSSLNYLIKNDNFVNLPIIGEVKLGGLSLPVAQEKINILYGKSFLEKPQLMLSVSNMKVITLGEFGSQGEITFDKQPIHLSEILAKSGGFNNRANKRRIKIIRGDLSNPQILIVNMENLQSMADNRLYMHNGDIVYAEPKSGYKTIDQIGSTTTLLGIGLSIVNVYFIFSNLLK